MILQLKCDKCGKVGKLGEVSSYHDEDLCKPCSKAKEIEGLKQEIAEKKEWLESTHLIELRALEAELAEIERKL